MKWITDFPLEFLFIKKWDSNQTERPMLWNRTIIPNTVDVKEMENMKTPAWCRMQTRQKWKDKQVINIHKEIVYDRAWTAS